MFDDVNVAETSPQATNSRLSITTSSNRSGTEFSRGATRIELPLACHVAQNLAQILLRIRVEAGERFVEQANVGLLRVGAGEKRPLLLATAEGIDLAAGKCGQVRASSASPTIAVSFL